MMVATSSGDEGDEEAVQVASRSCGIVEERPRYQRREKPSQTVKRRVVEAEDGEDEERQVEEGVNEDGVEGEERVFTGGSRLALQRSQRSSSMTSGHEDEREGGAEGPIAGGGELVLDEVADQ